LWSEDYWLTLRNVNAKSAWQLLEMLMGGEKTDDEFDRETRRFDAGICC